MISLSCPGWRSSSWPMRPRINLGFIIWMTYINKNLSFSELLISLCTISCIFWSAKIGLDAKVSTELHWTGQHLPWGRTKCLRLKDWHIHKIIIRLAYLWSPPLPPQLTIQAAFGNKSQLYWRKLLSTAKSYDVYNRTHTRKLIRDCHRSQRAKGFRGIPDKLRYRCSLPPSSSSNRQFTATSIWHKLNTIYIYIYNIFNLMNHSLQTTLSF